jgi:hypothetical protein
LLLSAHPLDLPLPLEIWSICLHCMMRQPRTQFFNSSLHKYHLHQGLEQEQANCCKCAVRKGSQHKARDCSEEGRGREWRFALSEVGEERMVKGAQDLLIGSQGCSAELLGGFGWMANLVRCWCRGGVPGMGFQELALGLTTIDNL